MAVRFPRALERAVARRFLALPPAVLRRVVGPPRVSADGLVLDQQLQTLLWLIDRLKIPGLSGGAVEEARASVERAAPTLDLAPAPGVEVTERTVPGPGGPLGARVYSPDAAPRSGAPGLVFFHGGGWVVGSPASHDGLCRALAARAGVRVLSVDYRLAPEHPFPAAVDDAVAATRWVLENADRLGLDPTRVAVGGDSAGGNLAAVVALALQGDARRPAFQLLIYPATDMTRALPSHALFRDSYFLSKAAGDWYLGHYLPPDADLKDGRLSPLFVEDLSRLPPALVITAGWDPLRDEGKAYAERLRAAGVEAELVCFEGQMHGFLVLGGAIRDGERAVELAAARVQSALAKRS